MNHPATLHKKLARLTNQSRALLVGINQYEFLSSEQQLLGSLNDVLSFWKVCRKMGLEPSHIVLLTSPAITITQLVQVEQELAADLPEYDGKTNTDIATIVNGWFVKKSSPKVVMGLATRKNIAAGVNWMGKPGITGKDPPLTHRLLTFSGHGATLEQDGNSILALCPSDGKQGDSSTYLLTDTLRDALKDVTEATTIVLDCCFAQNVDYGRPRGTHIVSTHSDANVKSMSLQWDVVKARVFCASGTGESAYQAILGGQWRGAFSWALTVALEQWAIVPGRTVTKHSTMSNIELLFRARMLLESLSFPQHPVLIDEIGNKVFLGQNVAEAVDPDRGDRKAIQIDPGTKDFRWYEFTQNKKLIAYVLVAKTSGKISYNGKYVAYDAGQEYWKMFSSPTDDPTAPLTVTWTDHDYGDAKTPPPSGYVSDYSFVVKQSVSWTQNFDSESGFFDAKLQAGLNWNIVQDERGQWIGSQTWYNKDNENNVFQASESPITLKYAAAATPTYEASVFLPAMGK